MALGQRAHRAYRRIWRVARGQLPLMASPLHHCTFLLPAHTPHTHYLSLLLPLPSLYLTFSATPACHHHFPLSFLRPHTFFHHTTTTPSPHLHTHHLHTFPISFCHAAACLPTHHHLPPTSRHLPTCTTSPSHSCLPAPPFHLFAYAYQTLPSPLVSVSHFTFRFEHFDWDRHVFVYCAYYFCLRQVCCDDIIGTRQGRLVVCWTLTWHETVWDWTGQTYTPLLAFGFLS